MQLSETIAGWRRNLRRQFAFIEPLGAWIRARLRSAGAGAGAVHGPRDEPGSPVARDGVQGGWGSQGGGGGLRWVERLLWALGVVCLGVVAYATIDAHWYAFVQGRRLDQALAARDAGRQGDGGAPAVADSGSGPAAADGTTGGAAAAPLAAGVASPASRSDSLDSFVPVEPPPPLAPAQPDEGALIGRIQIPRLGISDLILQGVSNTTLRRGVGHIPETALPGGQNGNIGLAGHRDTVFTQLKGVQKGDVITLETVYGTSRYAVDWTRIVQPSEVGVLAPDPSRAELTLVTCYPFHYIGSAPQRFIVRAHRLDGEAQAATPTAR